MKKVVFVRHAKSSWAEAGLRDHDRPLNPRGLRDAPRMAGELKNMGLNIDAIYTSTAKRTQETAAFFASDFEIPSERYHTRPELYLPDVEDVLDLLLVVEEDYDTVLVFGHNPCWTMLVNHYATEFISNLPTCGLFIVAYDSEHWHQLHRAPKKMTHLLYPKMLTS